MRVDDIGMGAEMNIIDEALIAYIKKEVEKRSTPDAIFEKAVEDELDFRRSTDFFKGMDHDKFYSFFRGVCKRLETKP